MNYIKKWYLCFFCYLAVYWGYAQEADSLDTEIVTIVKPYTPTISDAFKVKQEPILNDSIFQHKKEINYAIFSVPVASTFTPAKAKAETLEQAPTPSVYDNYATLGFGNYTTFVGELFSNFEISRTDQAGLYFKHHSSQGRIEGSLVDTPFFDTALSGNYTSRQKDLTYHLKGGLQHQIVHWYGLPQTAITIPSETLAGLDLQQSYFGVNLGGTFTQEDSVFEEASAEFDFLTDAYDSSEIQAIVFTGFRFPLADLNFRVRGDLDFLTGNFDRSYQSNLGLDYGFLNVGISPSLQYDYEDFSIRLGAQAMVSIDSQNNTSEFYIYPLVKASYRIVDEEMIVYGGVEGGLQQNSYRSAIEENPFVSPTLTLVPTNEVYNGFIGLKGNIMEKIGYDFSGSYGRKEAMPFFIKKPEGFINNANQNYEFGNSFSLVYDTVNVLEIQGSLNVEVSNNISIGATANFYHYSLSRLMEPWNLPNFELSTLLRVNFTKRLYANASLFFVGTRKDRVNLQTVSLDAFFDANVSLGYSINDRVILFAKGNNLLGKNYERWLQFPVQGIQGLVGATYKFNW